MFDFRFFFCLTVTRNRVINMKIKFNKSALEELKPLENKDFLVWDTILPGLFVRVRPSGRKSFYAVYRLRNHKQQKIKLGDFPVITVEDAREKCRELTNSAFDGFDPVKQIKDRAAAELDPAVSGTVEDLYKKYMAEHAIHKKASTDLPSFTAVIEPPLPTWQVMILVPSTGMFKNSQTRFET